MATSSQIIRARELIGSTTCIADTLPIRDAWTWFKNHTNITSLAVTFPNKSYGLLTRTILFQSIADHLNDPTWTNQPVSACAIRSPIVIPDHMQITDVVSALLKTEAQDGTNFNDIIVTERGEFLGLIDPRSVLLDHIDHLMQRVAAAEMQQENLANKNKELFDNSFRLGQTETQFRSIFERTPIPIIVFSTTGEFITANDRFYRLTLYPAGTLDIQMAFYHFFQDDLDYIVEEQRKMWAGEKERVETTYRMTLVNQAGQEIAVESAVELSPDTGQIVFSIVGLEAALPKGRDRVGAAAVLQITAVKPPGKITQAIKKKLINDKAKGLARSVATSLIDRDEEVESMMSKLESIIQVTEQINEKEAEVEEGTQSNALAGNLSEFSVIDLCQILIQGTKTGHLKISSPHDGSALASIYFYCGRITHAVDVNGQIGEMAIYYVVTQKNGSFEFIFNEQTSECSIEGDAMGLLMDACRHTDES